MTQLVLSIGSNLEKQRNIVAGLKQLQQLFGPLRCSSIYESDAAGFCGESFYNLVAVAEVDLPLALIRRQLKQLEVDFGRDLSAARFSDKPLDVDILTYGARVGRFDGIQLPRPEITESVYVLCPLAELLPNTDHPQLQLSYQQLWSEFSGKLHRIRRLDCHLAWMTSAA